MVFGLVFAWARRHPADARPGAAASGFPAGYTTRARPYFVHSRWAPPPSAVCSDRPASGSTPGSSRSRRGWCCGILRWRARRLAALAAAASPPRQGFRDIGPSTRNRCGASREDGIPYGLAGSHSGHPDTSRQVKAQGPADGTVRDPPATDPCLLEPLRRVSARHKPHVRRSVPTRCEK